MNTSFASVHEHVGTFLIFGSGRAPDLDKYIELLIGTYSNREIDQKIKIYAFRNDHYYKR